MVPEIQRRLNEELERLTRGEVQGSGPVELLAARNGRRAGPRESERRDRFLRNLLAGLSRVQPGTIPADRAGFGSLVRLRNVATGDEAAWTVMSGEYIDIDEDQVSVESPVGQALLGARAGERISVATPGGVRAFEVLSVVTLPQALGLEPAGAAVEMDPLRAVG